MVTRLAWVAVRLKTPNEKTDEELSQILVATNYTDDNSPETRGLSAWSVKSRIFRLDGDTLGVAARLVSSTELS
jgi:hypothetical protein